MEAAVASAAIGKPDGPAAMPVSLVKQPVVYTKRPGQITALAASPWAPLVAVAGQKQVTLYNSENGELLGIVPFSEGTPQVVRFSRNGEVLLVAGGRGGHSGCVVLYDVKSGKRIAKIHFDLLSILDHCVLLDRFERRENSRHRDHASTKCRPEIILFNVRGCFVIYKTRADGNTTAKRFCDRDDVGFDTAGKIASGKKPVASTANAGLYLIEYQQYPTFVTQ